MILKLARTLFILTSWWLSVSSFAFSSVPELPKDFKPWRIGVSMPSFYPVKVSKAYGVNEKQDWTVLMHNHMSYMGASQLSNVRSAIPDYDGFGLPLIPGSSMLRQIGRMEQLPDTIYLYWVSLFNQRFFVTQYQIPEEVKQRMMIPHPISYNETRSCYETYLYFGLMPNGQAKIWQGGCDGFTFIEEVPPTREMQKDTSGHDAEAYYRNYHDKLQQRASSEGITLDPIPWEKVNHVFYYDEEIAYQANLERMRQKSAEIIRRNAENK
ncbi:DUF2931 family protein [Vibrio olivae]|uniref:DUF2931 family protein n=1 Tax=Vibrio olivae TaxID=1243002 RepID=A0ABV5HSU7_9VIBR